MEDSKGIVQVMVCAIGVVRLHVVRSAPLSVNAVPFANDLMSLHAVRE